MNNFNKNIIYLEQKDFDVNKTKSTDNLYFIDNPDLPLFILFQSTNCGHCVHMKPEYQKAVNKFIKKNGNIAYFCTVEINNMNDFTNKKIEMFSDLNGVPVLYSYNTNGNKIEEYTYPERDEITLIEFFEKIIFKK